MVLEGYEKRLLERSALHTLGSLTGHKGEICSDGRRLNHRLWIRDLYRGPSSKEYSNPLISHTKHVPAHTRMFLKGEGRRVFIWFSKGPMTPTSGPKFPPVIVSSLGYLSCPRPFSCPRMCPDLRHRSYSLVSCSFQLQKVDRSFEQTFLSTPASFLLT